jgi:hypothetical protein
MKRADSTTNLTIGLLYAPKNKHSRGAEPGGQSENRAPLNLSVRQGTFFARELEGRVGARGLPPRRGFLARPATIPRARAAETGQKRIPIIFLRLYEYRLMQLNRAT